MGHDNLRAFRLGLIPQQETPPQTTVTNQKVLIGVATCHAAKYKQLAQTQRDTWVRKVPDTVDVRFFAGRGATTTAKADEVFLDCPDRYCDRKQKTIALVRWAYEHGYDYLWRVDDDVYLRPERLLKCKRYHYAGWVPDCPLWHLWECLPKQMQTTRAVLGPCVGLSRTAMGALLSRDLHPLLQDFEDLWCGLQLRDLVGIEPTDLSPWMGYTHRHGNYIRHDADQPKYRWGWLPEPNNTIMAAWEFTSEQMQMMHLNFEPHGQEIVQRWVESKVKQK